MKIVAIIQARMSSSRLPGKVLLDIAGQPMLRRVVERTERARTIDQVVVATTTDPSDDRLAEMCAEHDIPCYRGSLYDVLDRYYQAARRFSADVIVRITADCPLIDPQVVDITVNAFLGKPAADQQPADAGKLHSITNYQILPLTDRGTRTPYPTTKIDFAANRLPPPWGRTYPIGLDTEVCSFRALEAAWNEAKLDYQREHVMPYLYDNRQRFHCVLVNHIQDFGSLRWTVDTSEDLELVRQIYACFPGRGDFSWLEVLDLFQRQPDLAQINAQVLHKHYKETDQRSNDKPSQV